MALNATQLKTEIDAAYAALNPEYATSDSREIIKDNLIAAIATAVVSHILTNAVTLSACTAGGSPGTVT